MDGSERSGLVCRGPKENSDSHEHERRKRIRAKFSRKNAQKLFNIIVVMLNIAPNMSCASSFSALATATDSALRSSRVNLISSFPNTVASSYCAPKVREADGTRYQGIWAFKVLWKKRAQKQRGRRMSHPLRPPPVLPLYGLAYGNIYFSEIFPVFIH